MRNVFPEKFNEIKQVYSQKPMRKSVRKADQNIEIDDQFKTLLDSVEDKELDFLLCKFNKTTLRNRLLLVNLWNKNLQKRFLMLRQ